MRARPSLIRIALRATRSARGDQRSPCRTEYGKVQQLPVSREGPSVRVFRPARKGPKDTRPDVSPRWPRRQTRAVGSSHSALRWRPLVEHARPLPKRQSDPRPVLDCLLKDCAGSAQAVVGHTAGCRTPASTSRATFLKASRPAIAGGFCHADPQAGGSVAYRCNAIAAGRLSAAKSLYQRTICGMTSIESTSAKHADTASNAATACACLASQYRRPRSNMRSRESC
jgi:hypothetical protein